jgi:predicted transposase
MQRTICLKLNATSEQTQILSNTMAIFTNAFNYVAAHGWQHNEKK